MGSGTSNTKQTNEKLVTMNENAQRGHKKVGTTKKNYPILTNSQDIPFKNIGQTINKYLDIHSYKSIQCNKIKDLCTKVKTQKFIAISAKKNISNVNVSPENCGELSNVAIHDGLEKNIFLQRRSRCYDRSNGFPSIHKSLLVKQNQIINKAFQRMDLKQPSLRINRSKSQVCMPVNHNSKNTDCIDHKASIWGEKPNSNTADHTNPCNQDISPNSALNKQNSHLIIFGEKSDLIKDERRIMGKNGLTDFVGLSPEQNQIDQPKTKNCYAYKSDINSYDTQFKKTVVKLQPVKIQNYKYLLENDHTPTTANTTDNLIKRKQSLKATRRDLLDDLQADDDEIINNKPVSRKQSFVQQINRKKSQNQSNSTKLLTIKKNNLITKTDINFNNYIEIPAEKRLFSIAVAKNKKERETNDFCKLISQSGWPSCTDFANIQRVSDDNINEICEFGLDEI